MGLVTAKALKIVYRCLYPYWHMNTQNGKYQKKKVVVSIFGGVFQISNKMKPVHQFFTTIINNYQNVHRFLVSLPCLDRDDSKYGYDSDGQNFYLKIHHEFQKMVLISLKDLYKIHIFPKFHRCGSKIVPATPFWNLNFKWAWQAQFLSHTYETLEKYVFLIDLQMILVPFFDIPNQKTVIWQIMYFSLHDRPTLV